MFEVLVGSPDDFLLGDFNVHVGVGCHDEDGVVVVEFSVDFKPLEACEGILQCGFIHLS